MKKWKVIGHSGKVTMDTVHVSDRTPEEKMSETFSVNKVTTLVEPSETLKSEVKAKTGITRILSKKREKFLQKQVEELTKQNMKLRMGQKVEKKQGTNNFNKLIQNNTYHILSEDENNKNVDMEDATKDSEVNTVMWTIQQNNKKRKSKTMDLANRKEIINSGETNNVQKLGSSTKKVRGDRFLEADRSSDPRKENKKDVNTGENNNAGNNNNTINNENSGNKPTSSSSYEVRTGVVQQPSTSKQAIKNTTRKENTETDTNTHKTQNNNKLPPINIFNQNASLIVTAITKKLDIKNFYIKQINNSKHAIHASNIKDYSDIKKLLEELEVPYFTYTPKEVRNQTFLLKGLNVEEKEEDILSELTEITSEAVTIAKVSKFNTKKSNENSKPLPFFIISITSNSPAKELLSVKKINYQVVRWEKINKTDITQCYRCQRFGHTAANCHLDFRCVKCGQGHGPGECQLLPQGNDRDKLHCAQCGQNGHPASYRGCPKHVELLTRLRERAKINIENKEKMYTNYVQKDKSFSSFFGRPEVNVGSGPADRQHQPQQQENTNLNETLRLLQGAVVAIQQLLNDQSSQIKYIYDILEISPSTNR